MEKKLVVIICLFIGLGSLLAQSSVSFEEARINYGVDFIYAYTKTIDGGLALLCKAEDSTSDKKCMLLKLDNFGKKEWLKVLSGICMHEVYTLSQKTNGCYLVEGNSYVGSLGVQAENYIEKPVIVELNAEGDFKRAKILEIALYEF